MNALARPSPDLLRAAERKYEQTYVATDWAKSIALYRPIDAARAENRAMRLATALMVMSFANDEDAR